jgi:molybdate transport system regulatory protein
MKTSSRNAYTGKIISIIDGHPNSEVEIELESGEKICGQLSSSSCQRLGLAVGKEATALVKATEILLVDDASEYEFSCHNQFTGKIVKLVRGFVSGEVLIQTPSGLEINATVTLDGVNRLKLERGSVVTAMFKTFNVIIAIKK